MSGAGGVRFADKDRPTDRSTDRAKILPLPIRARARIGRGRIFARSVDRSVGRSLSANRTPPAPDIRTSPGACAPGVHHAIFSFDRRSRTRRRASRGGSVACARVSFQRAPCDVVPYFPLAKRWIFFALASRAGGPSPKEHIFGALMDERATRQGQQTAARKGAARPRRATAAREGPAIAVDNRKEIIVSHGGPRVFAAPA